VAKHGPGAGTVTSSPAGIECGSECQAAFAEGATVTLSATPGPNTAPTVQWTGCDSVNGEGKCIVTMSSAKSVSATFALAKHVLTVTKAGAGSGTVTSSPGGISCGTLCSAEYTHGETVTLSATPGPNTEALPQWSGCGTVTAAGKCEVVMSQAKAVTATFNLVKHRLSVAKTGEGDGTIESTPAGIACGATCSAPFAHGQSIVLSAAPDSKSQPVQWSGCESTVAGKCTVTMGSAREVTATFARKPQFVEYLVSVTKTGTGEGAVSAPGAGISCGATCQGRVQIGSALTLTATPSVGSVFAHWSGGGCAGAGPCTTTVNAAKSITAVFTATGTRALSVTRSGAGNGTVTAKPFGIECPSACSSQVAVGKTVTLTAKADEGSAFAHWSGDCSGTAKTCRVTMTEARQVTATFTGPSAAAAAGSSTLKIAPTAKVRHGIAQLALTCAGPAPCAGTLTLAVKLARKGRTLTIGQGAYALAAGSSQTLEVSLSRRARRVLRHRGALSVRASAAGGAPSALRLEAAKRP
jgi:hypothetical protein